MVTFKIIAEKLPIKWQIELRQALSGENPETPIDVKKVEPAAKIDVKVDDAQVVDSLVDWIRKTNRLLKAEKTFAGVGINLRLEKPNGAHIALNERNGAIVKQFLMK
jgi:hypothetical protein